jgi:septum formation inhibitor-activating ATPase MinD
VRRFNAISPAKEALIVTTSELPAMRMLTAAGLLEANGIFQMKLVNRVRSDMIQKMT